MITLPFNNRFRYVMLSGQKTATTRKKRYGNPGDHFFAFGHEFIVDCVGQCVLSYVADYFFWIEGFPDTQSFEDFWALIHPYHGYRPDDMVFLHRFHMIEG